MGRSPQLVCLLQGFTSAFTSVTSVHPARLMQSSQEDKSHVLSCETRLFDVEQVGVDGAGEGSIPREFRFLNADCHGPHHGKT